MKIKAFLKKLGDAAVMFDSGGYGECYCTDCVDYYAKHDPLCPDSSLHSKPEGCFFCQVTGSQWLSAK